MYIRMFVIDPASRQYGFDIPETGLTIKSKIGEFTVTREDPKMEKFCELFEKNIPFIVKGDKHIVAYNLANIVGVQFYE